MTSIFFAVLFLFSLSETRHIFEAGAKIPLSWEKKERVSGETNLILSFALKQSNLKQLDNLFWKVSGIDNISSIIIVTSIRS